jgi:hypothetical protein
VAAIATIASGVERPEPAEGIAGGGRPVAPEALEDRDFADLDCFRRSEAPQLPQGLDGAPALGVPNVVGLSVDRARKAIARANAGLRNRCRLGVSVEIDFDGVFPSTEEALIVTGQYPPPGPPLDFMPGGPINALQLFAVPRSRYESRSPPAPRPPTPLDGPPAPSTS